LNIPGSIGSIKTFVMCTFSANPILLHPKNKIKKDNILQQKLHNVKL